MAMGLATAWSAIGRLLGGGRGGRSAASGGGDDVFAWVMPIPKSRGGGFAIIGVDGQMMASGGSGGYRSGNVTRHDPDFLPQGLGPNAMADRNLDMTVRRSRDTADNNDLIDGAIDTIVNNVVGTGFGYEPDTPWPEVNHQLGQLWERASRRVDPSRELSRFEMERLFVREFLVGGDVIANFAVAEAFKGFPAGPAIDLIERERLDLKTTGTFNGNEVRQGVEYDSKGRVVAYHVMNEHPRDGGIFGGVLLSSILGPGTGGRTGLQRLRAEDCELAFVSRRPNQLRGVPRMSSVMATLRIESGFFENQMSLAITAATLGLIMEAPQGSTLFRARAGAVPGMVDAWGNPVERIEPGSIAFVPPGTKMPTPISSNVPGPNFKDVIAICQRRVSRAMGVPYSQFSGDSAGENFSSMRGNELAARAGYQPLQVFAWDHLTGPWWQRVVNWAVLSGKLTLTAEQAAAIAADPEALHAGRPIFKGYAYVNPAQESMANATDIEANVKSEIEVIGERGGRWRQVIEERARFAAEFRRAWKAHGLEGEPPLAAFSAAAPAPATLRQKAEPEKPAPPDGDKSESDDSPAREEKPASGFARGGIVNVPTSLHRLREMASGLTLEQIDGVNRHSNGVNGHA